MGLWSVSGNTEDLFITRRGKQCRDLLNSTPELRQAYNSIRSFWMFVDKNFLDFAKRGEKLIKPVTVTPMRPIDGTRFDKVFSAECRLVSLDASREELHLVTRISDDSVELCNIDTGDVTTVRADEIDFVESAPEAGEVLLFLKGESQT